MRDELTDSAGGQEETGAGWQGQAAGLAAGSGSMEDSEWCGGSAGWRLAGWLAVR